MKSREQDISNFRINASLLSFPFSFKNSEGCKCISFHLARESNVLGFYEQVSHKSRTFTNELFRKSLRVAGYRSAMLKSGRGKTQFILNGAIFKFVTLRRARKPIVIERDIVPSIEMIARTIQRTVQRSEGVILFASNEYRVKGVDIREILFLRSIPCEFFAKRFHLGRIPRRARSSRSGANLARLWRLPCDCRDNCIRQTENEAIRIMLIIVQPNCSFRVLGDMW